MSLPSICPKCESGNVARSHRKRWIERVFSEFGVFPFRCGKCGHRFSRLDFEALSVAHLERRSWLNSGRLFMFVVLLLVIAGALYYFRGAL